MSRHELGLSRGRRIVIGWDPPLQTFFLQVHNARGVQVWLGCMFGEISTVAELLDCAAPHIVGTVWAKTNWQLREQLVSDQRGNVA